MSNMEGYLENARGHLIPIEQIGDHDLVRDGVVRELLAKASALSTGLSEFRREALNDVEAFVQLSAERYNVQVGGQKGNVTLNTYDGRYRVRVQVADRIAFDERVKAAKAIIDECLRAWGKDSRPELAMVVDEAFNVDKEGKLNTAAILALTKLPIADARWQEGMTAIKDSIYVAGSATYVRFYERDETGRYQPVPLDLAAV